MKVVSWLLCLNTFTRICTGTHVLYHFCLRQCVSSTMKSQVLGKLWGRWKHGEVSKVRFKVTQLAAESELSASCLCPASTPGYNCFPWQGRLLIFWTLRQSVWRLVVIFCKVVCTRHALAGYCRQSPSLTPLSRERMKWEGGVHYGTIWSRNKRKEMKKNGKTKVNF